MWVKYRYSIGAAKDKIVCRLSKLSLHLYIFFALLILPRIACSMLVAAHLSISIASTLIISLKHGLFIEVEPVVHQVVVPW